MILMINNLAEPEPVEVGSIKMGCQRVESFVHGALIDVPS
jgi:hypothetical protein